jgi:hypothetical protein
MPRTIFPETTLVRLPVGTLAMIRALAEHDGTTPAEVMRRAIVHSAALGSAPAISQQHRSASLRRDPTVPPPPEAKSQPQNSSGDGELRRETRSERPSRPKPEWHGRCHSLTVPAPDKWPD